jgi:pyruvate/2-oxoglutarate dehydrogenase complex dihydrolipoamide acyltransferase (E2) component
MATQVLMPQFGESVVEGTITKWLKTAGEQVEEYEPLLEVNTDKVDTEIPSPSAGTLLATLVPEGSTVHAGTLLAWIGKSGESIPEGIPGQVSRAKEFSVQTGSVAAPAPVGALSPGRGTGLGFISPVVARIASEYQVDLSQVKGTGEGGRITKKDILAYVEARQKTPQPAAAELARPPAEASHPIAVTPGDLQPLTPVRRAIAEHMVLSKHTSPHVTTVMEADLSRVMAHREANKDAFARDGVNLTYSAYFAAAAVAALKAFPIANSSWSEAGILFHREINLGMATSLGEEGLIVPVVKHADSLSLLGLARSINDLAIRARSKKLQPEEVQSGTFTITNHGINGSLFASPIINQPQCAILGVGMIQKRVVVISDPSIGDTIAIRPMVYLSLTFDHRILDGAIADHFLSKVVEILQNWGARE